MARIGKEATCRTGFVGRWWISIAQDPSAVAALHPHGAGSETTIHINEGYLQSVPI